MTKDKTRQSSSSAARLRKSVSATDFGGKSNDVSNCKLCDCEEDGPSILCDGLCNTWYHKACSGLTDKEFEVADGCVSLKWFCSSCLDNDSIKNINTNKDKKCDKELNTYIIKLLDTNKNLIDTNCNLYKENSTLAAKVAELSVIKTTLQDKLADSAVLSQQRNQLETTEKLPVDVPSHSYSGAVKSVTKNNMHTGMHTGMHTNQKSDSPHAWMSQRRKTIIITPKVKESGKDIIKEVKQKIELDSTTKINSIKTKNDTVFIHCEDNSAGELVKEKLSKALEKDYEVRNPDKMYSQIKIVNINPADIDPTLSSEEACEKLTKTIVRQNNFGEHLFEISYISKPNYKNKIHAIAKLDYHLYVDIHQNINDKIYVNYNRCSVYEHVPVVRCFKCCGYNHVAKYCNNRTVCSHCGGEHSYKECRNRNGESFCQNCNRDPFRDPENYGTNHSALDKQCPIYEAEVCKYRKKVVDNS